MLNANVRSEEIKIDGFQTKLPCTACGESYQDRCFHHVRHRGSGGCNFIWNLMPLCLSHHSEVHCIGLTSFSIKYDSIDEWLNLHAWEFDKVCNKWRNYDSN